MERREGVTKWERRDIKRCGEGRCKERERQTQTNGTDEEKWSEWWGWGRMREKREEGRKETEYF